MDEEKEQIDLNGDGKMSSVEIDITKNRFKNRRRMAWLAVWSMVIFTAIMMSNLVDIERIKAIDNVMEMFYIAMASIVGAYMGFTTWATKKCIETSKLRKTIIQIIKSLLSYCVKKLKIRFLKKIVKRLKKKLKNNKK